MSVDVAVVGCGIIGAAVAWRLSQLGLTVTISNKGEKGEMKIAYKTLEQLDEVCRRLGQGN